MVDMLSQLLGVDFTTFHISNDMLYLTIFLFAFFITGEVFNIIRTVLAYFFERRK